MARMTIEIPAPVKLALIRWAKKEFRTPDAQATLLICEGLARHGYLPSEQHPTATVVLPSSAARTNQEVKA